jgi:hypothetical protein
MHKILLKITNYNAIPNTWHTPHIKHTLILNIGIILNIPHYIKQKRIAEATPSY